MAPGPTGMLNSRQRDMVRRSLEAGNGRGWGRLLAVGCGFFSLLLVISSSRICSLSLPIIHLLINGVYGEGLTSLVGPWLRLHLLIHNQGTGSEGPTCPLAKKKQNIKQKQSYNKFNKDFISGPQKSHRKSFENMSWVFTAGQACSRHLGPNMGKNKSLFLDKHHNLGSCQLQQTLGTFSHLSSFCSPWRMSFLSGYIPCPLRVFFRHSLSIYSLKPLSFGSLENTARKTWRLFLPFALSHPSPSWFSDLREGGRKKEM